MTKMKPILSGLIAAALAASATAQTVAAHADAAPKQFALLDPAGFAPDRTLPPPPAAGSAEEKGELATLRRLIEATTPARMDRARWDDAHEDPSIFDDAAGRKLAGLPATWALLELVHNDADLAANLAKDHFARVRPWGADPSLPNCDAGKGKKPGRSYPSGHATLGYSVGWALAQLLPNRAPAILARARDYALSREICGVHFPSDVEASHLIGTLAAARLFADPRLADRIAAARKELAAR
jgi:acid phosphatase (class A)